VDSVVTPQRKTEVVTLGSGFEERNAVWANSRRRYDAGYGIKDMNDVYIVVAFFESRLGRLYGFRFKDYSDFKSCPPENDIAVTNAAIRNTVTGNTTGDGSTATFQLQKLYTDAAGSWTRTIKKPVAGTVRVAVAGMEKTITTHFTVDTTTGIVTFTAGHIPTNGQAVTAGFEFDVPVRFDTDELSINLKTFDLGEVPSVPLVEVKL
jgi:uncharacterized protein (TIGR02217 family)